MGKVYSNRAFKETHNFPFTKLNCLSLEKQDFFKPFSLVIEEVLKVAGS